jgi:hypothetical protein
VAERNSPLSFLAASSVFSPLLVLAGCGPGMSEATEGGTTEPVVGVSRAALLASPAPSLSQDRARHGHVGSNQYTLSAKVGGSFAGGGNTCASTGRTALDHHRRLGSEQRQCDRRVRLVGASTTAGRGLGGTCRDFHGHIAGVSRICGGVIDAFPTSRSHLVP